MVENILGQGLAWLVSWPGMAIAAAVVLLIALRLVQRALRTAVRVAIVIGVVALVVGGLFVLRSVLIGAGFPIP